MPLRSRAGSVSRPKSPPSASSPSSPSSSLGETGPGVSTQAVPPSTATLVQEQSGQTQSAVQGFSTAVLSVSGTASINLLTVTTLILTAPDGSRHRVVVSNAGVLSTVPA